MIHIRILKHPSEYMLKGETHLYGPGVRTEKIYTGLLVTV